MAGKISNIVLTFPWPDRDSDRCDLYRVEQVTDSVEFDPGQMLAKTKVNELCVSKYWKVTVKPYTAGGKA